MTSHIHAAAKSSDKCYTGPVSRDENRAAAGGVCIVETCGCGAERKTNSNGGHVEQGPWIGGDLAQAELLRTQEMMAEWASRHG